MSGPDIVKSPFAGLVYCGNCNAPMFLSKAVKKNGREYVYYVCQKDDRRANNIVTKVKKASLFQKNFATEVKKSPC